MIDNSHHCKQHQPFRLTGGNVTIEYDPILLLPKENTRPKTIRWNDHPFRPSPGRRTNNGKTESDHVVDHRDVESIHITGYE